MNRKYYMLIGLLVILFVTVNIVLLERGSDADRTVLISEPISAKEKTLKATFGTDGVVEPSSVSHIYVEKEKGEIKSILVEEGQHIEEGTPLVEYVNESSQAEIETLEHANEELELKKEKLLEDRSILEGELSEAETLPDIEGQEEGDEHVHPSYDQTRLIQYEINTIEYSVKEIELEQTNNQAIIDRLKEESSDSTVESGIAGIVTKVHGENRSDGMPILTLASSNPLWVIAKVSEEHIHKVEAGQPVLLYPEFLKTNRVYGTVIDVGSYPEKSDAEDGQAVYPVTIEIGEEEPAQNEGTAEEQEADTDENQTEPETNEQGEEVNAMAEGSDESAEEESLNEEAAPLRIGAHVNADITLEEMTGLTLHETAVKYNKATVLHKGKLEQQPVTIGLKADEQYVIAKGLKEKQLILAEADLTIQAGTSYITMVKWDALTKKRLNQFSKKEFSLIYLQGLLQ